MEKFRSKILACFLAVALVVLTTPISLNLDTQNNSIEIQTNKAHAVVPVAGAAAAFLAEVAAASGLTVGEFVATVVGMAAVGTGIGLATDAGINYGNAASVNLGNLIDAADYPAWDTLTSEQQEDWGTKENYDSAKFNSLLDAFDLGDARERFYSSAGGNIDYTSSETSRLEQLGRIGQNWINNGANTVNDILNSMSSNAPNVIQSYYGASDSKTIQTGNVNGWTGKDVTLTVYYTNYVVYSERMNTSTWSYFQRATGNDVYCILMQYGGDIGTFFFSENQFMYGDNSKFVYNDKPPTLEPVSTTYTSSASTWNDKTYYVGSPSSGTSGNIISTNCVINSGLTFRETNSLIPLLLFNEDLGLGSIPSNIVGYPEDIQDQGDTNVYFPSVGVVPGANWEDYETQPETPPIIDEEVDLTEIIQLLQRFHFTVDYNLLVQDNPLRSAVMELVSCMNKFSFYAGTGQLKVHDEGVYDAIGDLGTYLGGLLNQIQATLSGFFVTDTATDVIGDLDFPDLGDKAVDLVDTISTLAPFGAMFLISELVAILSQVGKIQTPSMVFDFNFMPEHEYDLTVDLSWLADAKPIINVACIITLIVALAGTTARLIELEAAA